MTPTRIEVSYGKSERFTSSATSSCNAASQAIGDLHHFGIRAAVSTEVAYNKLLASGGAS